MSGPASSVALLALGARLAMGTVLLRAAIAKAASGADVAKAVAGYRILPARLVPFVGRALVPVEFVLGTALAVGLATRPTALAAAVMVTGFGAAIALNVRRGRVFECGCGTGGGPATWRHVLRNAALAVLAVCAAAGTSGPTWELAAWPDALPVLMTLGAGIAICSLRAIYRRALFPKEMR